MCIYIYIYIYLSIYVHRYIDHRYAYTLCIIYNKMKTLIKNPIYIEI